MASIENMKGYAIAVGSLAVIDMVAIAIVLGFKNTNLVDNTTADSFVTGLTYFATFTGLIVLGLVGKILMNMFSSS